MKDTWLVNAKINIFGQAITIVDRPRRHLNFQVILYI